MDLNNKTQKELLEMGANLLEDYSYIDYMAPRLIEELKSRKRLSSDSKDLLNELEGIIL